MARKSRLGLYLDDEETKKQIKVAAAKRGTTVTDYCVEAIEDRLVRDGERSPAERRLRSGMAKTELLARMDELRKAIGPVGVPTSELVKEGRRR